MEMENAAPRLSIEASVTYFSIRGGRNFEWGWTNT
jgi:hypothetical protein